MIGTVPDRNNSQGRVSEWLAASLEMKYPARGCEFESRALRFFVQQPIWFQTVASDRVIPKHFSEQIYPTCLREGTSPRKSSMTTSPIRFHRILMVTILLLPGVGWGQNADSKSSPFEQLRWVDNAPEVLVHSEWYTPIAIQGVDVKDILDFCQRQWPSRMKKRFGEDLPVALELMGHPLTVKVDLTLVRLSDHQKVELKGIEMSRSNRTAIWQASQQPRGNPPRIRQPERPPPVKIGREKALADITQFQKQLEDQFAYRHLRGIDLAAELDAVRTNLKQDIAPPELASQLNVVLAKFGDGHASVSSRMFERPSLYPPFLLQDAEGGVTAFLPNRSGFVDNERPFILAIDGVTIDDWIDTVRPELTSGSPQLVRVRALRAMRAMSSCCELIVECLPVTRSAVPWRPDRPTRIPSTWMSP